MSYRRLDAKGKPIPRNSRSIRKPAERMIRGIPHYHYEIFVTIKQQNGKSREIRKRFWLADDREAEDKQRELKHQAPVNALTWIDAHALWLADPDNNYSDGHIATSRKTIELWTKDFGADSTIEGTELSAFTTWISDRAKEGTGRAAQIKHEHMLAIARWCRERGLIKIVPFEYSPKPKARTKKRGPASVEQFHQYAAVLPESMIHLWWLLGLSGARLTAVCELLEAEITDASFTVLTKFRERVTYPITDDVVEVIAAARKFKAERAIDSPFLFTKENGRPWRKDSFNQGLDKAREKHGLPKLTSHQLRHMAGTVSGEEGLSVDQIQALLAQKDRRSSEDYVDKTMGMRKTGMLTVGRILKGVGILSEKYDNFAKPPKNPLDETITNEEDIDATWRIVHCPHCHRNHIIPKE